MENWFFLPFSRVPKAVAEFFAFYFSLLRFEGGFFRLVWNSDGFGPGGVGEFPPCQGMLTCQRKLIDEKILYLVCYFISNDSKVC